MRYILRNTMAMIYILLRPVTYRREFRKRLGVRLGYEPTRRQVNWCYWDFLQYKMLFGGSKDDYFKGQMFRKSNLVRRESLSRYIRFPWRNAIQDKAFWRIFTDKTLFYEEFDAYLGRKWMVFDEHTELEELASFAGEAGKTCFVKEPESCGGHGVYAAALTDASAIRKLYDSLKGGRYVLEQELRQCREMREFYPEAVNTCRIVTIIGDSGKPYVAKACLRIGNGGRIDNFSSGGMSALIDIETGIVTTPARDGEATVYVVHPVTKKQIVGYKIDDWQSYKEFALALAEKYPRMRYVGWDIMKDESGKLCVIEGNKDAGADYFEVHMMGGLIPEYEKYLKM